MKKWIRIPILGDGDEKLKQDAEKLARMNRQSFTAWVATLIEKAVKDAKENKLIK